MREPPLLVAVLFLQSPNTITTTDSLSFTTDVKVALLSIAVISSLLPSITMNGGSEEKRGASNNALAC